MFTKLKQTTLVWNGHEKTSQSEDKEVDEEAHSYRNLLVNFVSYIMSTQPILSVGARSANMTIRKSFHARPLRVLTVAKLIPSLEPRRMNFTAPFGN